MLSLLTLSENLNKMLEVEYNPEDFILLDFNFNHCRHARVVM